MCSRFRNPPRLRWLVWAVSRCSASVAANKLTEFSFKPRSNPGLFCFYRQGRRPLRRGDERHVLATIQRAGSTGVNEENEVWDGACNLCCLACLLYREIQPWPRGAVALPFRFVWFVSFAVNRKELKERTGGSG